MLSTYKHKAFTSMCIKALSFLLIFVILSFTVVALSLSADHNCTGEHCFICFFVSEISVITTFVFFGIVSLTSFVRAYITKLYQTIRETLITLKSKITS